MNGDISPTPPIAMPPSGQAKPIEVEKPKVVLEPCPCGQIPAGLMIEMQERAKYGRALGDCCTEWSVEFRNGYSTNPDDTLARAQKAWNAAPRGVPSDQVVEVVVQR